MTILNDPDHPSSVEEYLHLVIAVGPESEAQGEPCGGDAALFILAQARKAFPDDERLYQIVVRNISDGRSCPAAGIHHDAKKYYDELTSS